MSEIGRALPSIEDVCHKHNARLAFRLRAEYFPGPAAFPDSEEERDWLAHRETLVVTVMRGPGGWTLLQAWSRGERAGSGQTALPADGLEAWGEELEARGAWSLPSVATLRGEGEGYVELEQESNEYHDEDPDSLDLESWSPPRRWRVERSRPGAAGGPSRALAGSFARFLPEALRGGAIERALAS